MYCSRNLRPLGVNSNMLVTFTDSFLDIVKQCLPTKTDIGRQNDAPWLRDEI